MTSFSSIQSARAGEVQDQPPSGTLAAAGEDARRASRERFETAIYQQYFLNTIEKSPQRPFGVMNVGTLSKAQFLARDEDGSYNDDSINGAWWAWRAAEAATLQALAAAHRFTPLPVEYAANGNIVLPPGKPFDGTSVLLQTRAGVIEGSWIAESRSNRGPDGIEVEGFLFYAETADLDIDIDEVQGWMPVPPVVPETRVIDELGEPMEIPR